MALSTPTISIADGPGNAAVNLSANAVGNVTAGQVITVALQSSTGVLYATWLVTFPGTGVGDQRFVAYGSGPFSFAIPAPPFPCTMVINTEVTDGNNITSNVNTVNVQRDGNWVTATNVSTAVAPNAASNFFFMGALLRCKASGLFQVDLDIGWSGNTTADTVTFSVISDTSASGALAGTSKSRVGYNALAAAEADLEVTTNGANAITYNGAAWNTAPIVQRVEANPTLTGLLSGSAQKFVFHQICGNSISTTKTPFTQGNTVAFGVKVTATNQVIVPEISMSVRELHAG